MLQTIVGKRGFGKTTLAKHLVRESPHPKIFVLDYILEYQDLSADPRVEIHVREALKSFYLAVREATHKGSEGQALVVLDEVDLYGKNNVYLKHLYRYGRHYGIDCIAVSRRFFDLPLHVRALTDVFHVFRISEPRDLEYLSGRVPRSHLETIRTLERFKYVSLEF
jgi:predicted AAA+ superfamily ATPase